METEESDEKFWHNQEIEWRGRFHTMMALIKNENGELLIDTNEQLNSWADRYVA